MRLSKYRFINTTEQNGTRRNGITSASHAEGAWLKSFIFYGREKQAFEHALSQHAVCDRCYCRRRIPVIAPRKGDSITGPVAQWIRHRPTEPGIAGSSPAGVICQGVACFCFALSRDLGKCDPGRTRTCNLWFRRPTPYPLGHRASCCA